MTMVNQEIAGGSPTPPANYIERHDALMTRAEALTAESPGGMIRRVLHDMHKEAARLFRVFVSELQRHGAISTRRRDQADIDFNEDEWMAYNEEELRAKHFGPSAEELARLVVKGSIGLDDVWIGPVSRVAARLRAATVAATRLERLLAVDPRIETPECIDVIERYDGDGDPVDSDECWMSLAGNFIVRHFVIAGLFGEAWEERWRIMIFAATVDWEIMSERRPVGGAPDSYDGPVSHAAIGEAIGRLSFDAVVDWISGFTDRYR